MRRLIVNADDFGLTTEVNKGIIEAYRNGIVTSTTIMVNMPGFADAVEKIRCTPGLAVGIHLNLTYGVPVLGADQVRSLVGPDGRFKRRPDQDERILELVVELAKELGVTVRALEPEKLVVRGLVPKARFQNYFGESDGVRKLVELIKALPEGVTEICCHPGYCDVQLRQVSTLNEIRERELAALTAAEVRQAISEARVKLVNYREV